MCDKDDTIDTDSLELEVNGIYIDVHANIATVIQLTIIHLSIYFKIIILFEIIILCNVNIYILMQLFIF